MVPSMLCVDCIDPNRLLDNSHACIRINDLHSPQLRISRWHRESVPLISWTLGLSSSIMVLVVSVPPSDWGEGDVARTWEVE